MKLKKILPYNIRRMIPMLGLGALSMMPMASCSDDDEPHDIELTFMNGVLPNGNWGSDYSAVQIDKIRKHLSDPHIRNIYLKVSEKNDFTDWKTKNDINFIKWDLEQVINLAPDRIFGRGDFHFVSGVADPADSIWFVTHGWTVNQTPIIKVR